MTIETNFFGRAASGAARPKTVAAFASIVFLALAGVSVGSLDARAAAATPENHTSTVGDLFFRVVVDPSLELRRFSPGGAFSPGHAEFSITVDGRPLLFEVQALPALPSQALHLLPTSVGSEDDFTLRVREGEVQELAEGWIWTAPAVPGAYPIEVARHDTRGTVSLTVLVAYPADAAVDGQLHGYRLGRYKEAPLRGNPAYLPPQGFVEVPDDQLDLAVSPHFALGQFLCKQEGDRRFILLSPDLVAKLEAGLEVLNADGHAVPTFHVMSGFRTPAYNQAIGNTSVYSRHLYGDAADIFIDVDADGYMDDLNGDGRRDRADAQMLMGYFERLTQTHAEKVRAGGLSTYGPKPHRGPFIHVDTRGNPARW